MGFEEARERMVQTQIAARGITDARVLAAMRRVPRHLFVPEEMQEVAYADQAMPIGSGQTISQPYMVAAMSAALELTGGERVFEIGTGSGYQTAILAELACEVISIERHAVLARTAEARLAALGWTNVRLVVGDGSAGLPETGPFDAILVTAGAPRVPEPLKRQLADGGRLVIPVGAERHQDLIVLRREGEHFRESVHDPCVFVPLVGQHGWRE
jgi:protein-L-isoaspartate(D-aspartate) O-methyltransferase